MPSSRIHRVLVKGRFVVVGTTVLFLSSGVLAAEAYSNRWPPKRDYANPAITRAMEAVREAILRAKEDPTRPIYHFRPPARWMNGSDGLIFHKGYYHFFYQLNPYGDQWGLSSELGLLVRRVSPVPSEFMT